MVARLKKKKKKIAIKNKKSRINDQFTFTIQNLTVFKDLFLD